MVKRKSSRAALCELCGGSMRKNGFTSGGRQRWRCDACRCSRLRRRPDATRLAWFRAFLDWLLGGVSMGRAAAGLGMSARTFARGIDWCWRIRPRIESDGVAHRFVLADGTYVPHGWCLLVA
ncbi:IS1 family transposase, partial [Bifidobacterium tsurumiense]|uniref:IS1 family transposase n=4 Tax=Bifidobacterium tsurumiense TaxID=356829 RepID=UPI0019552D26